MGYLYHTIVPIIAFRGLAFVHNQNTSQEAIQIFIKLSKFSSNLHQQVFRGYSIRNQYSYEVSIGTSFNAWTLCLSIHAGRLGQVVRAVARSWPPRPGPLVSRYKNDCCYCCCVKFNALSLVKSIVICKQFDNDNKSRTFKY